MMLSASLFNNVQKPTIDVIFKTQQRKKETAYVYLSFCSILSLFVVEKTFTFSNLLSLHPILWHQHKVIYGKLVVVPRAQVLQCTINILHNSWLFIQLLRHFVHYSKLLSVQQTIFNLHVWFNCLEDDREDYQNCSVLYCVPQLHPVICTLMWAVLTGKLEPTGLGLVFMFFLTRANFLS